MFPLRLWHSYFPVNSVKNLKNTFFDKTSLVAASVTCSSHKRQWSARYIGGAYMTMADMSGRLKRVTIFFNQKLKGLNCK